MTSTTNETTLARYRRELAALPDDALTTEEAAVRADVSIGRVYQWLSTSIPPLPSSVAIGLRWIRPADLDAMPRYPDGVRGADRAPRTRRRSEPREPDADAAT
jgi:hypothetical protein